MRDNGDFKPLFTQSGNSKAHTVDGNTTLEGTVAQKAASGLKPKHPRVSIHPDVRDLTFSIHMTLHQMAAQKIAHSGCRLQVYAVPFIPCVQVGQAQRLRRDLHPEELFGAFNHSQTDAVHTDTVPDTQPGAQFSTLDGQNRAFGAAYDPFETTLGHNNSSKHGQAYSNPDLFWRLAFAVARAFARHSLASFSVYNVIRR